MLLEFPAHQRRNGGNDSRRHIYKALSLVCQMMRRQAVSHLPASKCPSQKERVYDKPDDQRISHD